MGKIKAGRDGLFSLPTSGSGLKELLEANGFAVEGKPSPSGTALMKNPETGCEVVVNFNAKHLKSGDAKRVLSQAGIPARRC